METLLGGFLFATFLLAHVSAVVSIDAAGKSNGRDASHPRVLRKRGIMLLSVALGAFWLSFSAYSQELRVVAHQFLQRHGVPCRFVLKVVSPHDLGEVAMCEDGRVWALLWLEDEIAFIHPRTREAYKWDRSTYLSHPELYSERGPNS